MPNLDELIDELERLVLHRVNLVEQERVVAAQLRTVTRQIAQARRGARDQSRPPLPSEPARTFEIGDNVEITTVIERRTNWNGDFDFALARRGTIVDIKRNQRGNYTAHVKTALKDSSGQPYTTWRQFTSFRRQRHERR